MPVDFHPSSRASLGVEVELALVDVESGALVCLAPEVLEEISAPFETGEHPKIKKELFQCTIEVITGVCQTVAQAKADLTESMRELQGVVERRGAGFIGAGLHPFTPWHELSRSEGERYERLVDRIGWPVRRLTTHGVHVHVGVRSGDKAIATVNSLTGYLPIFLALSASSPYWNGRDTQLASTRTKIFEAMPTTGLPPQLRDWNEFNVFLDTMITSGTIETVREVWWDIRPHPTYGTVELRMCDAMPTLWETVAMAALAQCLVQSFDEMMDRGETPPVPREWIRRENKWRAARWGIDAELVVDDAGHTRSVRDLTRDIVVELAPVAERLGCSTELADLLVIADRGPSYVRQRRLVDQGAELPEVVMSMRQEMLHDLGIEGSSR
ncbi:MAG: glutamate--cysteine ligase [Actinomycetales bacterium mxb001]|nr:MAG: glutamate--cysteine ligase [Actinomycetales bacterium mxb001]